MINSNLTKYSEYYLIKFKNPNYSQGRCLKKIAKDLQRSTSD